MKHILAILLIILWINVGTVFAGQDNCRLSTVNCQLNKATDIALSMARSLENDKISLPRSFQNGKLITSDSRWWCSGFFAGTLWYLYQNAEEEKRQETEVGHKDTTIVNCQLKNYAIDYTERVRREQYTTDNHDVGFIIMCSFGKGVDNYNSVIIQAARSLATRYNEKTGVIRSWSKHRKEWQYPVIIDNMMNLELLMRAAKLTDNKAERKMFERIATNHADNTVKNHFRTDYSSCHLVDYDTITGKVRGKYTVQGYADSSAWARGQAWALYGYTMMYRETGTKRYLQQAENIARFIIEHPHLPNDKIPYWDFDAPDDSPRDASSAAIMASAFIELSSLTKNKELAKNILQTAKTQLLTLSSPEYFAEPGTNGNFILKHSVGHFSENSEVDVPLTYADYYYVEAMIKYKQLVISN